MCRSPLMHCGIIISHQRYLNKSAFSLLRWLLHGAPAARRLQRARSCRSMSPARRALSSKPAARRRCCRSMGQTDRPTDGQTDARPLHKPCSAYWGSTVSTDAAAGPPWTSSTGFYLLPAPDGQRSIAMSMSVRLCPRLSVYYAGSVNNIAVSHWTLETDDTTVHVMTSRESIV